MTNPKPRAKLRDAAIPALAALLIGGAGFYYFFGQPPQTAQDKLGVTPIGCILDPPNTIGGPLALTDVNGRAVTQADFAGAPALVYFGFTNCPDICPNTLYLLDESLTLLGEPARAYQPILVTLDPDRDTTDVLAAYVGTEGFPEGLVGLTGTEDEVSAIARRFAVNYNRAPLGETYTLNHTSFLYVMDAEWRPRAMISTIGRTPEDLAACIRDGLSGEFRE